MTVEELRAIVDVVMIAVRSEDEIPELEARFPVIDRVSRRREYLVSRVPRTDGDEFTVVIVKSLEGPAAAQQVMNDVIEDLAPTLTLTVGIGGGVPPKDGSLCLGDVVLSSGGLDVTRGEILPGRKVRIKPAPFPLHNWAKALVDNIKLPSGSWDTEERVGVSRPPVRPAEPLENCPTDWAQRGQACLSTTKDRKLPRFFKGTIGSGSHFVKDELSDWERATRKSVELQILSDHLLATDMETLGVHRASVRNDSTFSWLSIRGISDITGLTRDSVWSRYASATAASFTLAFIRSLAVQPRMARQEPGGTSGPEVSRTPLLMKNERALDKLSLYIETYLGLPPLQQPEAASVDPQLSSVMLSIVERLQLGGDTGVIIDIGCGRGVLLQRLLEDADFSARSGWLYVAVDSQENLDSVQQLARKARIVRRVEPVTLDSFYAEWPLLASRQVVVCRNVLHELTIVQTAQLLRHIAANLGQADTLICQDLMSFPQGERHNACWFHTEFQTCVAEHGFANSMVLPITSKGGSRWFNLLANGVPPGFAKLSPSDSERAVTQAREQQWLVWSQIDRAAAAGGRPELSQVMTVIDLDLQLAALTRQLRDAGAFVPLEAGLDKRLRIREITKALTAFVSADKLERPLVSERARLRERGEQLNVLEEFLRGGERLIAVTGGGGSGKTTLVEHLLATRSYGKSPVIVDAKQATDLWSFVEKLFTLVGFRLVPERLSVIETLDWQTLEVPLRQFANKFASRFILFIDNFDAMLDTNQYIQDPDLGSALSVLLGANGAKVIIAIRGMHVPTQVMRAAKNLNPKTIRLGRYATDETVINILDDRFDRAAAGLATYPQRLIQAIDRHPLAAMLTSEILHKHGRQVLLNERLYLELEQRLHQELWSRLVDEGSKVAVQMAAELRIPVPRRMLVSMTTPTSVAAGLDGSALYLLKDRRWEELISTLAVFRRRRMDEVPGETEDRTKHDSIADQYLSIYRTDDDPKWLRESYFHRMLAGGPSVHLTLGGYYLRELISSANYCFLQLRDFPAALELYDNAAASTTLSEEAQMHRASSRIRVGERPAGEKEFQELIEHYPTNMGMRTSYVDALLFVRDYDAARQKLTQLGLDPDKNDWVAGQWGRVWMGLNEYAKAEAMFRKQMEAKPLANPQVFLNLAHALQYQGAVVEALKVLERGQKLHENNVEILATRGACLERLRRDEDAMKILEPLFESRPDRPNIALPIIKILGRRNNVVQARRIFERAQKRAEDQSDAVLMTAEAELLKAENRHEAAMQLLRGQKDRDQHVLGMLLECCFHHAQSKQDPSERARVAREALAEEVPLNLIRNVPLVVNRSRLAALARDRALFESLLEMLQSSRVEKFEIQNLEHLWEISNPS